MSQGRLEQALHGVSVTTATPFTRDLSAIDTDGIRRNMEFLLKEGIRLVVPCGNTGEFYSLSEKEWLQVVKATLDASRGGMVVMPGVGHSITTAVDMVRQAESMGAQGVMVMYPQHVFSSEEGVLNYYRRILDASKGVDVVLYKKGPLLTDAVLKELMTYRNLVGIKYAFGRVVDFAYSVQMLGSSVIWSCGTAERFAPFYWLAGARAFTSGLANFAPRISLQMYHALVAGNYEEAMTIQALVTSLENLREGRGTANNVPVVKAVMDHLGLAGGECRPPIHSLNRTERKAAIDAVAEWALRK